MIYTQYMGANKKKVFRIDKKIILFSSLFMGILASIPKILQLHITLVELMVDAFIALTFSLYVWYFNLYKLPKFSVQSISTYFFYRRLAVSMMIGFVVMAALVSVHHLAFPKYRFSSMMMMYQFRGVLINLTIYTFLYLLYQVNNTQQIRFELEKIKADNLNAQYELLKQQINPHFLFNSLNTLKSMVDIGDPQAGEFVVRLSDFYRYTLDNRKLDLIPLKKELSTLKAYFFLLTSRFESGIDFSIEMDEATSGCYIPPFTLQLLAENCIKHNVVSAFSPLRIKLYCRDGFIIMENNFQPKNVPQESAGIGLENIRQRYRHFIEKEVAVLQAGNKFIVKLPIIYEDSNN